MRIADPKLAASGAHQDCLRKPTSLQLRQLSALASSISQGAVPESICLKCGLCCDGTIFADVRLQQGDDSRRLQKLGLPLAIGRRKPQTANAPEDFAATPHHCKFHQPCAAFDGCRCRIYDDRPRHCRNFECGVLKSLREGRLGRRTALRIIRSTRDHASTALSLLRQFGDTDESLPIAARFRRTTRRLEEIGLNPASAQLYGKLTLAMHDLNFLLSEAFYPGKSAHEC